MREPSRMQAVQSPIIPVVAELIRNLLCVYARIRALTGRCAAFVCADRDIRMAIIVCDYSHGGSAIVVR